jgi:hypothetical protein
MVLCQAESFPVSQDTVHRADKPLFPTLESSTADQFRTELVMAMDCKNLSVALETRLPGVRSVAV